MPRLLRMLVPFVVLLCMPVVTAADEIAAQTEKLQQLRARIDAIRQGIEAMHGQHDALQAALKRTETEIGSVTAELRQLDARITTVQAKIQNLNAEHSNERIRLTDMRAGLVREFQRAYMAGRQEQVRLLLSQEDPAAVGRMLVYHGYFARARSDRVQAMQASLAHMSELEQQLLQEQSGIVRLRQQQADKSARLGAGQDNRRKVLAQLQAELQVSTAELSTLEQDQTRLTKLLQSLALALQDIPATEGQYTSLRQLKGKLRWPVAGRITQSFGARDAGGTLRTRGVQIATRNGADVRAIAGGRIAFSDWLRGFGLLLIIDHGNGYMSLYGQNRSLYKEVGEWVVAGETVAAAGVSGGQARAGLYLELRKDGKPFNPAPWFRGKPQPLAAR